MLYMVVCCLLESIIFPIFYICVFIYDRIILAACNRDRKGETQGEGTPPMISG